ncbi:integrin beta-PS-like [Centruroides sculpturatus]|uniref:integrin beta-PS-like n=1 Tax=Centruroides sculpturatus TaxID=218467 RepID=UPI000C6CCC76|nr:integrin beta-PS-like [Centruroides sculpturatus]
MKPLLIPLLLSSVGIALCQLAENLSGNPCVSRDTCGKCITADPECAWCSEENIAIDGEKRCDYRGNLYRICNISHVVVPGQIVDKLKDDELSNKGVAEGKAIQIKPQEIRLRLRPKSKQTLKVEFRQAEDYPVDLYYLMDLSKSMEDDKTKLAQLGDLLSDQMGKITANFRLGFGSFVDKVVMPYVSTVPEKLKEPCTNCAAPYGFHNHMPLTLNTSAFAKEVNSTKVSGNLDAPEGGFDAIMQAIVCEKEIGWRKKSRKMLVFSSDSGFHYAGDGKLGGIVKPNDGRCHLDKNGYYTESVHQDYPSLSQINHKIMEHKVNIIFAVTANQVPVYSRLSEQLEGSSTGKLENDSSNVVTLVKEQYNKITSGVEMKDNATGNVKITYHSKCLGTKREKTNSCTGLKVGTSVTFEAEIEVTSCPKNRRDWNQTFRISPVGLNEALIVHLEMICECDCEKPENEETFSSKCSDGNGTFECGICSCYSNRFGRQCECDAKDINQSKNDSACRYMNEDRLCSGRGICQCGICECFPRSNYEKVEGKFCECDNFTCDRSDGKICNGPDHGICECGKCKCLGNWTGSACDCLDDNETCIAPNGKLCSGNGECVCGACKCFKEEEEHYSGQFCEECPTCRGKCDLFKECVQCKFFNSGPLTEEECLNCSITPVAVEKIEVKEGDKLCAFRDDDDCKFFFTYRIDSDGYVKIHVQRTKDCPEPVNILAIVLGVIGGIVAVGLALLLIWKLLTTIHDRREFAKFEKERQMAKWDTGENPIYKQATSTFKNPTYGGKQ